MTTAKLYQPNQPHPWYEAPTTCSRCRRMYWRLTGTQTGWCAQCLASLYVDED